MNLGEWGTPRLSQVGGGGAKEPSPSLFHSDWPDGGGSGLTADVLDPLSPPVEMDETGHGGES